MIIAGAFATVWGCAPSNIRVADELTFSSKLAGRWVCSELTREFRRSGHSETYSRQRLDAPEGETRDLVVYPDGSLDLSHSPNLFYVPKTSLASLKYKGDRIEVASPDSIVRGFIEVLESRRSAEHTEIVLSASSYKEDYKERLSFLVRRSDDGLLNYRAVVDKPVVGTITETAKLKRIGN